MRLITTTNVSVDGVMQGLGGPDEDRSGGFARGGWAIPLLDTEAGEYLNQVYGRAAAFLFGRRTYEIFAGYWGAMADPSTNPIAAALNSRPKYVVSTSLTDPQWAGTTVLTGDVAAAISDLKAHQDGELLVPGSGALVRSRYRARSGRLAHHFTGHNHPDVSTSWAPGVRNVHSRPEHNDLGIRLRLRPLPQRSHRLARPPTS